MNGGRRETRATTTRPVLPLASRREGPRTIVWLAALLVVLIAGASCGPTALAPDRGEAPDEDHDDPDSAWGTVTLSAHVVARNGIRSAPAQTHLLLGALEVPAAVQVDGTRLTHVAPLTRGRLSSVGVGLGDRVERGQVLATMQSTDLGSIRAALIRAQVRRRMAEATLARKRRLTQSGVNATKELDIAQGDVDQAKAEVAAARAELSVYGADRRGKGAAISLRSPLTGIVLQRHAIEGEVVDSATTVFVVADLSRVWVVGHVFERDVARVVEGLPVEVSVIAAPGRSWRGVVDNVGATLDPSTRTVSIRVELDNADGLLRPGLFGTIAVGEAEAGGQEVLAVPDSALQRVGASMVVFAEEAPARFVPRVVVPGARAHGLVEIKDGLDVGTSVVVAGSFALKSKLLEASLGQGHAH